MQSQPNSTHTTPMVQRAFSEAKALFALAFPLMISQLAQTGMGFVDTVMAGRHSEVSLAGVAIGSGLWIPSFLALMGIMMAATPMIAHAYGANRNSEIKTIFHQALWLALLIGIGFLIALRYASDVLTLLEMEADVFRQAKGYVEAVAWGLPALAGFQVFKSLNEGFHLTRPFMLISIAALIINIPLNYVLIYGKLGLPALGGVGCGWATAIVIWLELLMMIAYTLKNAKFSSLQLFSQWSRPDLSRFHELLRLGVPIGVSFLIESSMFALIALFIAKLGATVVSGHQIAMSFASLIFMLPLSIALAVTIRCGYCLGRGEPHRARTAGWTGIGMSVIVAAITSSGMLLFPESIASLYTQDPAVKTLATELLIFAALFQFSDAIQVSAAGALRGYKDTLYAFLVVIISYWGVGLPLGYTLGLSEFWGAPKGPHGFWIGLIVGLTIAAVLISSRFWYLSKGRVESTRP